MKLRSRGRFSVKRISRVLSDRVFGSPFDRELLAARDMGRREFVFGWNRGLGDVALGLCPLFARIRKAIPGSHIVVFTRADLEDVFRMADIDAVHVVPGLVRGAPLDPLAAAREAGIVIAPSAVILADPDPTRWLDGRRREHPPALRWDEGSNPRGERLVPATHGTLTIGAHVSSETSAFYGYVKDWPASAWQQLFARFPASSNVRWLLFGNAANPAFLQSNLVDLRGQTSFIELLAAIRTRCRILVAPDSGVLTAAYYLDCDFALDIVSLWSDPRQGILKQGCPSPNPRLRHTPLLAAGEDMRNLGVDAVGEAIAAALARSRAPANSSERNCR